MKHFQVLLPILTLLASLCAQAFTLDRNRLYHAGDRELLRENIQARTVPPKAWKNAIFASKTNFDLPAYRKGLYGAESVAGTNLYLMYQLLAGHTPWIMSIGVNSSCLPASYDSSFSLESGAFAEWLAREKPDDVVSCAIGESWNLGTFYDVSEQPEANSCVSALDRFMRATSIPIAFDLVNNDSWYIRERRCISTIEGTVDENLRALLENRIGSPEASRLENWYGDNVEPGAFYAGNTIFLLSLLSESRLLKSTMIPQLDSLKTELDERFSLAENPRSLKLDRTLDNPKIVALFLASAMIEIRKGRIARWQTELKALLKDLVQAFGRSCHGRHGVSLESRRSCLSESDRQSLALIQFLDRK